MKRKHNTINSTWAFLAIALCLSSTIASGAGAYNFTIVPEPDSDKDIIVRKNTSVWFSCAPSGYNGTIDGHFWSFENSDVGVSDEASPGIVTFAENAEGKVSKCTYQITHTDENGSFCNNPVINVAYVCVPKVTIRRHGPVDNTGKGFSFQVTMRTSGIDDLSKVEITQLINSSSYLTDYSGSRARNGSGVPSNTNGYETDTGWDWAVVTNMEGDDQVSFQNFWDSREIGGSNYEYAQIQEDYRDLKIKLRRVSDQVEVGEFVWGYDWDNLNIEWKTSSNPPRPSDISSAVLGNLGAGQFSNVYGIDGGL